MNDKVVPAVKSIIERDGKLLVLKTKASGETYHVLPGGKIEYGESPRKALKREIREEISCSIEIGDPVGMYYFFKGPEDEGDQVVLTVFEGDVRDQEVDITDNPADEGIVEAIWMRPEKLIEKSGNSSLKELIRDYKDDLPKLVRDRIPEIIREDGQRPDTRKVDGEEYRNFLLDKIREEASELAESGDREEIADLFDVVETYMALENFDREEVEDIRKEKNAERGGFSKGFILEDIE